MRKTQKYLSLFIVSFLLLSMCMMLTVSADFFGTDGTISWNIDVSQGTLTVEGNGTMPTYKKGTAPWYKYNTYVKSIVVPDAITISSGAFYGMESVKKVELCYIGDNSNNAFFGYIFGAPTYYENVTYVPESLEEITITATTSVGDYAFNNMPNVKQISLPSVTYISNYAFKDCISLEKLGLGSSLTSIASTAFLRCDALEIVAFGGNSVKWAAVYGDEYVPVTPICISTNSLELTAPTKTIYTAGEALDLAGFAAKLGSTDVTKAVNVTAPNMLTVGTKSVKVDLLVTSATFDITVKAAENSDVSGIATWAISDAGVLTISGNGKMDNYTLETLAPWYAYRDSITSIVVNDGITSIGAYAFYGLNNVTSIDVASTVDKVEYSAFANCVELSQITLGNTFVAVAGSAFNGCNSLITEVDGAKYASVSGNSTYALISVDPSISAFTIPATTVVIADGAFENCATLAEIAIPDSVVTIGNNAFASCTALSSVTLGSGVKSIGDYAFLDCSALNALTFNSIPEEIGAGALSGTSVVGTLDNGLIYLGTAENPYAILWKTESSDITTCTINADTKVIADLAFANCTKLEAVQFPTGLIAIGDSAFNNCSSLYSVQLPDTIVLIGDSSFKNCTALTSVALPNSLKEIGDSAFRGATALETVLVRSGVELVGYNAFRDCTALRELVYDAKSIGYKTFANCTSLKYVSLADSVVSIGKYAFMGCNSIIELAIPNTTASIGFGALYGATSIVDLAVPFVGEKANGTNTSFSYIFGMEAPSHFNSVLVGSDIPQNAFDGISIITLVIDKTTTSIADGAFEMLPANNIYLGSAEEWALVEGSDSLVLPNMTFANSTFSVSSEKNSYVANDVLDRNDFTATINGIDVTPFLRFPSNVVMAVENKLPSKIGSVVKNFKAADFDEIQFTNYSLLLEGSIGLKFYVKFGEFALESIDDAVATVEYYDKVYNVELEKAENTTDGSLYTAKFYVAAKETALPVTLTVTVGEETKSITRTVKNYVEYVNKNSTEYADCLTLINEMYNYGEYSRQYFDLANITPAPDLSNVEINIPAKYAAKLTGSVTGLNFVGTSLLLESNTTVRHYFELSDGANLTDYEFKVNGIQVIPEQKDGMYYIDIDNIIARNLGRMDKTTMSCGTETLSIMYSPLTYAKLAIENYVGRDDKLVDLSKALYNYYLAAFDYFRDTEGIDPSEDEIKPSIW